MKRLRTIAGILIRDISRKLPEKELDKYKERFELYIKIINQKQTDSNKIYSLHEPHIYAVAKGKDHKKYEYGTKASIVTAMKSSVIIGIVAHKNNEHDSKTLKRHWLMQRNIETSLLLKLYAIEVTEERKR